MTLIILYLLSIPALLLFMVGLPTGTRETPETLERQFWMRPLSPTPEIFPVTDEEMDAWVDGLWPGAENRVREYAWGNISTAEFIEAMDSGGEPDATMKAYLQILIDAEKRKIEAATKWDCARSGHVYASGHTGCTQCSHARETLERRAELVAHFSKPLETPESQGL